MQSPVKIWRSQKYIAQLLGKTGAIISWTVIRVPPEGFSSLAPYPVALVELTDHTRITAPLVDWTPKDLMFGTSVVVVLRRISEVSGEGIIPYGVKVKPV